MTYIKLHLAIKKRLPLIIFALAWVITFSFHSHVISKNIEGVHTWRQCITQLNIRNFTRIDANILNPRVGALNMDNCTILRYEFPLMQWLIGMTQRLTGEDIMIGRLYFLLAGLLSMIGIYKILLLFKLSPLVSSLNTWFFFFSPIFYVYKFNLMPDVLALCFSIWYLYYFVKSVQNNQWKYHFRAAIFLALAAACKLPFIMIGGASVWYFLSRIKQRPFVAIATYILCMLPSFAWYYWVIPDWGGNKIASGIFDGTITLEKYMEILEFNILTTLPNTILSIPASILLLIGFLFFIGSKKPRSPYFAYTLTSFIFVLLFIMFVTNQIGTHHDYYLIPFMPPLFLGVAYGLNHLWKKGIYAQIAIGVLFICSPIITLNQVKDAWTTDDNKFGPELYHYTEELRSLAPRDAKCIMMNDISQFIMFAKLDKLGFVFRNDHLPSPWIEHMIKRDNVQYMYSYSRKVDEREDVQPYLDSLIGEYGNLRVFRLVDRAVLEK